LGLFDEALRKLVGGNKKAVHKNEPEKVTTPTKSRVFASPKTVSKPKPLKIVKKQVKKKVAVRKKIMKHVVPKKKLKLKPIKKKEKSVKKKASKKEAKPKIPIASPIDVKISKARTLSLIKDKEVMDFIIKNAGEESYKVFDYLVNVGKEVDEYTLADKVNLQINFVRSLLYKLYVHKLVSFFRERDKKKGWFIYSWLAHPEKLKYILIMKKEKDLQKLHDRLRISEDSFFCAACDKTTNYSHAMETMFFCDVCGGHLIAMNSLEVKDKVHKQIEIIKKEVEEIRKI
jgi:transcription factor E